MHRVLALLGLIACGLVAAEEQESPRTIDELKTAIAELVDEREVPAVSIAPVFPAGGRHLFRPSVDRH